MEQQRAETGEQQRRGDVQTGQDGDEHRRAEHGEHVLEAEQEHSARTELSGIVDAVFGDLAFTHDSFSSLSRSRCVGWHKKRIVKMETPFHNSDPEREYL